MESASTVALALSGGCLLGSVGLFLWRPSRSVGALALVALGVTTTLLLRQPPHETDLLLGLSLAAALFLFGLDLWRTGRAADAARERERCLLETPQVGLWILDGAGRTLQVNTRLASMLGHDPASMRGAHFSTFVFPPDLERADHLFEARACHSAELALRTRDGRRLWAHLSSSPFPTAPHTGGAQGSAKALIAVRDITSKRQAEAAERCFGRLLEQFVMRAPRPRLLNQLCLAVENRLGPGHCLVTTLGKDGKLVLEAAPGLSPALRSWIDGADPSVEPAFIGPTLAERSPLFIEDTSTHPTFSEFRDLLRRWGVAATWTVPIHSPAHGLIGALTYLPASRGLPSASDERALETYAALALIGITERRTLRELEETQAHLTAAINQSPAGIVIADAESGRVQIANDLALGARSNVPPSLEDLSAEELPLGWTPCHPDGRALEREELPLVRALRHGQTSRNVELLMRREDGLKRWILAGAAPVRDLHGHIRAGVAVYLDITTRKRDERDLRRLLKGLGSKSEELDQFFQTLTHDLRAPLINIAGFAGELGIGLDELEQLLVDADLPAQTRTRFQNLLDGELRSAREHIAASAQRMEALMRGMARLNTLNRRALKLCDVDLNALLREVRSAFEFRIRELAMRIEVGLLPPCRGDHGELGQVFSNLLDNALKYRDPKRAGRVRIAGRRRGNRVLLTVTDNGIGIQASEAERIFQPFYRGNGARFTPQVGAEGSPEGEGLGLAILRRSLSRMDGKVRAVPLEKGLRFEIDLPAAEHERPDPLSASGSSAESSPIGTLPPTATPG